jgi:hypothetical protein
VSREAPHSTRVQLEVCPIGLSGEFAPDSEKSRRQIWFCESHRHTEQRNQKKRYCSSPPNEENWPVEIKILLLKKQVLITTLNLGIFRLHYCWKDPFIPCLKGGLP